MQDNISKLYGVLKDTYDLGSEEDFRKYLSDSKKREALRKELESEYEVGDSVAFTRYLGFDKPTDVKPYNGNFTMSESELEGKPAGKAAGTSAKQAKPQARQSQPQQQPLNIPSIYDVMDEQRERTKLTPMFGFDVGLDENGNRVSRPRVEKVPVAGTPVLAPVYRDFMGNEYDATDPNVQKEAERQTRVQTIDLKQANREQVEDLSQIIDDALLKAKGESVKQYVDYAREKPFMSVMEVTAGAASPTDIQANLRGAVHRSENIPTEEAIALSQRIKDLEAAQRSMRNAKRIIEEADHNAQSGTFDKWLESSFAGGAVRGFGQKLFDIDTWDMGMSEMQDATSFMKALSAFDKGEKLTESQQAMLDAKAVELATNAYFGSYVGRGYKAGQVTGESIPFMLEMMINPASSVGTKAQNMLVRYALKRFGRKLAGEAVKKTAGKAILTGAKAITRATADIAGAAVMAGTTGMVGVAADAQNRMNGNVRYDINDEGKSVFVGHESGKDFGTAFKEAFAARTIENYSEMFGEYFAPLFGIVGKSARKGLTKVGLDNVNKFIDNVSASDIARLVGDFERRSKWNGTIGEYAEEVVGGVMNALVVGDQTLDTDKDTGVFNLDNNIDTFLGVSLLGGAISTIKTAGYRTPKYRARQDMTEFDKQAAQVFGNQDTWGGIRNAIAFGEDADVKAAIKGVLENTDLTREQKLATLQYAKAVQTYKGIMASEQKRREEQDPVLTDTETSFDNGYALEGQEMNDAKNMLELQQQRIGEIADEGMMQQLREDPMAALDFIRTNPEWTNEEKQAALDYVNAKATYDGMIARVGDDIDSRIAESDMLIGERRSKTDGMIHPATMKAEERKVYVVDGNVSMMQDGTMVDVENSDESVIVRDAETGEVSFVSPHDILSVDEAIDADEEMQTAREAIQQEYAQQAADKIDGVLPFNDGDVYDVIDEEGQQHTIEVVPYPDTSTLPFGAVPEGSVLVSVDGAYVPQVMSRNEIQNMADAYNLTRLAEYEQAKQQKRADEVAMQSKQTEQEEQGGAGGEASPEQTGANEPSAATVDAMPMIGEGEDAEPDFLATTPERAHSYLYNEAGLSRDEANQFVEANKKAADKELEKAKKGKPQMGTSLAKYKKEQSEYQQKIDAAQQVADYWQAVKDAQQRILSAELDARAAEDAANIAQAQQEEQLRQEEELRKQAAQAALGTNNVAPAIREKWDAAPKVEGARNEIVLANGERVPGKYVLVESGAATPSHNPRAEFAKNEGFPQDENGQSVNDRDYEGDKDAQTITRQIASNYDQRALQSPVVVTNDGVVLSGNGRTMAGELAARDNTDGAYIGYLLEHPELFGFTKEQVESMAHPRVLFVPDDAMPYTADTFAKFNQQEMKGQSKTEQAVKLGKLVDDATFGRVIRSMNAYDTLGDFYADISTSTKAINELRDAGAISQAQYAEMFDGDAVSARGREMLEAMLIGKAFESNPNALRQLTEIKSLRQSVLSALAEISNNIQLGEDYSLESELSQAIDLAYQARKSGYSKAGDKVSGFARQGNLFQFDEGATIADCENVTVLLLADILNDNRSTRLKNWLAVYNKEAKDSAQGQMDLFTGDVKARQTIIDEVNILLNNGTEEEIKQQLEEAAEQRKAEVEQSLSEDGTGSESNEGDNVEPQTTGNTSTPEEILAEEAQVNTEPTEAQKEAGNYKKGHVKIDGFDVTIENPKGSERSGTDASGKQWRQTMHNTYGYIRGTEGVDGDHIDVFLSDAPESGNVYVIDQRKADGSFDEHKVMYGFNSAEEARDAYLSNYEEGWKGLGAITPVSKEEFKKWIESSHRKTKPFSEYKSVETLGDVQLENGGVEHATNMTVKNQPIMNNGENAAETSSYSVTPKEYVTKKGKKLAMHLVKFDRELTPDEYRKAKALAKKWAGWWSREDGGFLMRDEMAAETFANTVLDAEALEDEQPLSLQDIATAMEQTEAEQEENPNANYKVGDTVIFLNSNKTARLKGKIVRVDKTESFGTEYEVESIIVTDNGPGKGVTSRPHTYTILEGQIESKVAAQPQQTEQQKRLVSDERMEELKARLRKKMFGQLNMGVDPEILAIGAELAVGHIERGLTKFADYAKAMIADLGDAIRPYLKSFYNAVRDMPEAEEYVEQMDSYDDVRTFDVLSLTDGETAGLLEKAEEIAKEQDAEEQAEEAKEKLTEQRNDGRKVQSEGVALDGTQLRSFKDEDLDDVNTKYYYQGKRVYVMLITRSGEQVGAMQFTKPRVERLHLSNGQSVNAEDMMVADETKEPVGNDDVQKILDIAKKGKKTSKSKKKDVSLQQEPDLFSLFGKDATNVEPNDSNNDEGRENRPSSDGVSQRAPEGSERADSGRLDGNIQEGRNVGQGNSSVSPAASGERSSSERPVRRLQSLERPANPKNLRNNHAERGKDYAPKGVDARIEANIKAIELMQQLIESGEQATPEQMAVLRQFSGWGGLGKAFENYTAYTNGKPTPQYLRELLGEEAYEQANMSRNSAYYTPAGVIDALWNIARAMGFKGGNMLEGSAGIGNIIGLMPEDMSERSNIHAVEIDQTTGNILKLLYPDASVEVQGFEATQVENGSVDLAITNVPFVTGLRVNDTTGDKDLSKKFHDIHDFCIAKNIRKLREGGIGIFITSSGTLDNSAKLREWIIQEGGCDVVGAFRLHNETFGGTGATSDIIVVRKRVNGRKSPHAIDVLSVTGERTAEYDTGETKKVKGAYVPVVKQLSMDYNAYFVVHPEMMAGEMHFGFEKGDSFRPTSKALYPARDKNQAEMLQRWAESFGDKEWEAVATETQQTEPSAVYEDLGEGVKEGSLVLSNGTLCIAQRGKAVPLEVNANKVKGHTKVECFEAYKGIKDALAALLEYQTMNESNDGLQPLLKALNKAYDAFVKTYGHLHKNTSISFLKNDVDFANILALEKFSERPDVKTGKRIQEYGKTDIFSQRVVEKEKAQEPKNVKDAIIASIYVHGRIDLPWMVEKLSDKTAEHSMTEQEIKDEIIASGLGFENPTTRQIEVSYEYLSGNVREKLRQAQENNTDGKYDANIKALEAVIPTDIPAHLIDFSIGSSWIDPKFYEEYVREKTDIEVKFTSAGGTWHMQTPSYVGEQKNRAMGVTSEILHKTIMGTQLIEAAMQNKTIEVKETRRKWNGETETISDKDATQACANKIDEIRQDFKDWARAKMQSDTEMREEIERIYNETFNNYVPKSIPDEFVPAHFGGAATMVDGKPFALRPHQGKAVVRGTTQPLLLAHEVGTGKTYTLISTAMEMRRLGTARKPMIVVQNATVGQFVESAKKLYPNAKVLTLEEKDHTSEGRKNFYAKIKYNDWDMIVVPQSVFERIPDSEERQMKFVQDKIEEKLIILEQMRDADPKSMIVRQAEKEIASLEEELAALTDTVSDKRKERDEKKKAVAKQNAEVKALEMLDRQTDDVENFDDMGIDAILVDEAHEYKHLGFATAMQRGVKGVDPSYSKKAQGVYLKTQAVLEKNNGRNVIFATGTPISNTAAEIWTFMRYLMPADTMKDYGIYYFDDFVRNFGNLQQMLEFTTSGKFKENNRFAGYVNLPELVRIWAGVADTVLTREAGGVNDKIPAMEGEKATDIYLPQTRALRSVMKFVKKELERYDKMSGKEKKENSHIPLTMYGIAKAAAVDARLVVTDAADEEQSKTNEAVRQTLRTLKETASYKGTIALFADNYQNKKSGFNLYEDIRRKLIEAGVPAEQIVVMKSGMSVKKKLEIFDAVNRGEIRVIMGSTFTLGTGVNIQERLHTLIHLDAPNRPMDYTQRNGRILRQGNLHKEMGKPVRVLRFGVEDSLDVTAYQRLKTKGAIADSIMNGKQMMANSMENRALEEEEDVFGDTVAQLSGSEYAMLKNQAEKDVRKYEAKKKQYEADQTYCHSIIPKLEGEIAGDRKLLELYRKNLEILASAAPGYEAIIGLSGKKVQGTLPKITIGKQTFESDEAMADFLKEYNKSIREVENKLRDNPSINSETRRLTVNIGGIDFVFTTEISVDTRSEQGELFTAIKRKMTYTCEALGLKDQSVRQSLLREGIEEVLYEVMGGDRFRRNINWANDRLERNEKTLEQVRERYGKPFEYEEELKKSQERLDEYSELMKQELEEKEKKYADIDATVEDVDDITEAEEAEEEEDNDDDGVHFRLREEAAPQKTGIGYKVFVLKDGNLYPPMVANPNGEATQTGVWLDADAAPIVATSKTGRSKVKAGGKGTQGGSGTLANRPGWHLGEIPYALQFNRGEKVDNPLGITNQKGEIIKVGKYFPGNFVWAEVEYADDVNYQEEAMSYGINEAGNFQHSLAGLPHIPTNGSYTYRTNANPATDPWIITGAMKVKRILKPSEVDELVKSAGRKPQLREAGAVTDEQVEALNKEIQVHEIQERYDELAKRYNGKPYTIVTDIDKISDEEFAKAIGATDEVLAETTPEELHEQLQEIRDDAKKRKVSGGYSTESRKIVIFAENISHPSKTEEAFFHENIHGILHDWYENGIRTIADRFYQDAPKHGFFIEWDWVNDKYKDKPINERKEEFFVYSLSRAMTQGKAGELLDWLAEEDSERIENIINAIGYDRRTEEARRAEAEEQAQGDLGQDVSRLLPTSGRRRLRDGEGEVVGQTEEERRAESRRAGYSRRQYEAWREREYRRTVERVNGIIDKLNLRGRVVLYDSFDDVPKSVRPSGKALGKASRAKGWFDEKTGRIVVILGNHGSVGDFIKTILHEGVAHYGLRRLFGSNFNQFLDNVFTYADESIRREIVELAKKHGWNTRVATEEYLARLAEDTDFENAERSGWWQKVKSFFLDMLHRLGLSSYSGSISDNELRYILWRSYKELSEPGSYRNLFRQAEDIDKQMKLGVGRFEKERIRIAGLGLIDDSRRASAEAVAEGEGEVLFRDGDFSERDRATARDAYERMVSSGTYQFQEAVQDSMLGLKKLMEAILGKRKRIEDVAGWENAYLAENRMSSVNAAEQHDYYLNFMKPLLDEVFEIAGKDADARQALTDYMMAKHGLERNIVFAERDAKDVEANGGDFNEAYNKFREKDYAGLTALTGEEDLVAAEAVAKQFVDAYEAAHYTGELWNRVREATHATLEKIYRSGLLITDRYEHIRDMFEYYIPLQGWDETTSDEVYGYLTSKNGAFGSPIKHASGRSSKADDPIATIGLMADTAIRQGNRNQMKQRFLNFVLSNPSDLVSVHDLWLQYNDALDEWEPVFADLEDSDTAKDVERKVAAFEERMEQLAEAEPDRYKRGSDTKNIPYKVVKGNLKEHQVLVNRSGHPYVLTINGNPRAAQALNGLTNPDVETSGVVGNILKLGEYINRNLSAFYTTRNPDFVISNFFRDMLYSNCMIWVKESPRYALRFHKNFGRLNPGIMRKLLGKWEKGTLDQSKYIEGLFYQFMMNGGETGYTSIRDIEAHKKEIADELKKQGSTLRQAWAALGEQLDLLNRGVENCARFAAFVTSREMGRSIDRSIYDAKEVSVNFNKKGSGGKMVNATGQTLLGKVGSYVGGSGRLMYVFWNAGVQGLTNFGRSSKRHPAKAFGGASAMFILGYVVPMLAAAMGGGDGDDDDKNAYYNLPEYVRRTNICFRFGEQWITIPLPIEFRGIYGLGELASGVLNDNEHYDNKELTYQVASQVSQIFPLDFLEGGGGVNAFIPSSLKPFAEAYIMNKSWTGLPIYKDTPWNQNYPEWTKAYKNADKTLVAATKWLNEATGGDDFKKGAFDINPSKLEYLLNGLFGGYMNTAEKMKKMAETAVGSREFEWRNMLLANRVVKSGDERTANRKLQNEYFKYRKEYEETKRLLKKYENAADEGILGMAEKMNFLQNSPEYLRYEIFDEYRADIDDYREDIKEAANDAERNEIEADMYATMRELIDQLHEVK